jgi:hypothetical protein
MVYLLLLTKNFHFLRSELLQKIIYLIIHKTVSKINEFSLSHLSYHGTFLILNEIHTPGRCTLINLDQIEEWLHEVEQRPSSAALIIRYIANRLKDLSGRNEELLAENIELRTGRKVDEYEGRIANLEYQLEMLKRQMASQDSAAIPMAVVDMLNVLVYNIKGQVLRVEIPISGLEPGAPLPGFGGLADARGPARLLVTSPAEELLFVFDTGRTEALPVTQIPVIEQNTLDWTHAYLVEPRGGEELATILPIARMSLYDYCIQVSRRGCVKKMMKSSFEAAVANTFVGAGIKNRPDKTCTLTFSSKEDALVIASREGFLNTLDVSQLPYTIEEVLRLSATDYLVSSFALGNKAAILLVTDHGKTIHRESGWIEKSASFKSKGQAVFSQSRREAGTRVAAAAAVDESDWGIALPSSGPLSLHKISDLFASGTLDSEEKTFLDFTAFSAPVPGKS